MLKTCRVFRKLSLMGLAVWMLCPCLSARAATASPLYARGYTVLPSPQKVKLGERDFRFGQDWRLRLAPGISSSDIAITSLNEELQARHHLTLRGQEWNHAPAGILRLAIVPNSIAIGDATDSNQTALAEQAYKIFLAKDNVTITANASAGLFYGVQTFLQLLKPQAGALWLTEGEIVDWPDLDLRIICWDDAHHLERPGALERAIRQAAFYKINGFAIKLDGHFQYKSAVPIVEPYALTPSELKALTDEAVKYHVQLIPYLDGPAHISFILKHPEYARLREYPQSNYEACATNPDTYNLFSECFRSCWTPIRAASISFSPPTNPIK